MQFISSSFFHFIPSSLFLAYHCSPPSKEESPNEPGSARPPTPTLYLGSSELPSVRWPRSRCCCRADSKAAPPFQSSEPTTTRSHP